MTDLQRRESEVAVADVPRSRDEPVTCELCSERAVVRALERYDRGRPVFRRLCLGCADVAYESSVGGAEAEEMEDRGVALSTLVVGIGLAVFAVVLLGDNLGVTGKPGLGVYQTLGLVLGAMIALVGALTKVELMVVGGGLGVALAASADLLALAGRPGMGWKEQLAAVGAGLLVAAGLFLRRRERRRRERVPSPQAA